MVDDLSLFSVFVRTPLIGSLMWMACDSSSSSATKQEDEEAEQRLASLAKALNTRHSFNCSSMDLVLPIKPALKRTDYEPHGPSVFGEYMKTRNRTMDSSGSLSTLDTIESHLSTKSSIDRKKIRWSDEIGHDLVTYADKVRDTTSPHRIGTYHFCSKMPLHQFVKRRKMIVYTYGFCLLCTHLLLRSKRLYCPTD